MYFEWAILRDAGSKWVDHNSPRRGAALAYYTILSLAPLLVIIIAIGGIFFGDQAVRGQLAVQMEHLMGPEGARSFEVLLRDARRPTEGIEATSIGFAVLLMGASGVFIELRETLNEIWDVPQSGGSGVWGIVRSRFLSFLMIVGIGILLLASLVAGTLAGDLGRYVQTFIPLPAPAVEAIDFCIALLAACILFALIYRFIPEIDIGWEDVAIGSAVTAVLFEVGKFFLGFYLDHTSVGSAYGAAGSLVVLLVWVYYSSQIFLYGAEITRVYSDRRTARASKLQTK